jgi:hypothetical protein
MFRIMKILLGKYFTLFIILIGICDIYAGKGAAAGPPAPDAKGTAALIIPPPPPGLAIDENFFVLFIIAILFGTYIIYRNNLKTKKPI